jgi:hypothetical protein
MHAYPPTLSICILFASKSPDHAQICRQGACHQVISHLLFTATSRHTYIDTCMRICMYVCMYTCMYVCTHLEQIEKIRTCTHKDYVQKVHINIPPHAYINAYPIKYELSDKTGTLTSPRSSHDASMRASSLHAAARTLSLCSRKDPVRHNKIRQIPQTYMLVCLSVKTQYLGTKPRNTIYWSMLCLRPFVPQCPASMALCRGAETTPFFAVPMH